MLGIRSKKPAPKPEFDLENLANPKSTEFAVKLAQTEHELALMRRVPEMRVQARDLESNASSLRRTLRAIEAGFDPIKPTKSWYMGFLSKPDYVTSAGQSYRLYTRAIPEFAIEALDKARALNLFNVFTVHSPDATAFTRHTIPMPRVVDPILIGWIGKPNPAAGGNSYSDFEAEGFLVAQWDLAADLAFSQLLLASPEAPKSNGE